MEIIDIDSDNEETTKEKEEDNDEDEDKVFIKNMYSITIRLSDYNRLSQGRYLNDNLIDFFLNYSIGKKKPFYAFNSFFYCTLIEQGYEGVKKWYKNIDIFSKKYWLIPIASMDHWILIIIISPINAFITELPSPIMLLFDSMDLKAINPQAELENFIKNEWNSRGNSIDNISIPLYMLQLPQQLNLYDCGIFLLEYAEKFIKYPFKFKHIDEFSIDYSNWFDPNNLKYKRDELKNILIQLRYGVDIKEISNRIIWVLKMPYSCTQTGRPKRSCIEHSFINFKLL